MEALILQDLYKIYKEGDLETVALREACLKVQPGEFVAVTGRSGAGKSTLLHIIGGLTDPSAGRVMIDGTDIARLSHPYGCDDPSRRDVRLLPDLCL